MEKMKQQGFHMTGHALGFPVKSSHCWLKGPFQASQKSLWESV